MGRGESKTGGGATKINADLVKAAKEDVAWREASYKAGTILPSRDFFTGKTFSEAAADAFEVAAKQTGNKDVKYSKSTNSANVGVFEIVPNAFAIANGKENAWVVREYKKKVNPKTGRSFRSKVIAGQKDFRTAKNALLYINKRYTAW